MILEQDTWRKAVAAIAPTLKNGDSDPYQILLFRTALGLMIEQLMPHILSANQQLSQEDLKHIQLMMLFYGSKNAAGDFEHFAKAHSIYESKQRLKRDANILKNLIAHKKQSSHVHIDTLISTVIDYIDKSKTDSSIDKNIIFVRNCLAKVDKIKDKLKSITTPEIKWFKIHRELTLSGFHECWPRDLSGIQTAEREGEPIPEINFCFNPATASLKTNKIK